ncbi:hypothetical protein GQ603_16145 [Clavibacter michiganensis subsp. michiganensis]|nr:hypothetical protein [Clavibacter michiganensis subsp. michiganensis]QIT13094.1 hypothetical protein GRD74_16045 [Clavibacter michiganensis subsp. michiganensis]
MTQKGTPRRPRGTIVEGVTPKWTIEKTSREAVGVMARTAGISPSYWIDLMIQRELSEFNDHGVPSWIREASTREELPIDPT